MSSPAPVALFVVASLLLLAAHVIRSIRWRFVLKHAGLPMSNLRPLVALSMGYLVNTLLPFRLGEFVRAGLLSYTTRSSFAAVLATVIFERTVDLVAVAIMALVLFRLHGNIGLVASPAILAAGVVFYCLVIDKSRVGKRMAWMLASIFNVRLRTGILHLVQVLTELLGKRSVLANGRFWVLSIVMWTIYLASLLLFALSIQSSFVDELMQVYFLPIQTSAVTRLGANELWLLLYLSLPIPVIIAYSYLSGLDVFLRLRDLVRDVTRPENFIPTAPRSAAEAFGSLDQYAGFLDRRFEARGGLLAEFENRGLGTGLLHRVFHGGSGAITALIEIDGQFRVRKFATGTTGEKLETQRRWLERHGAALPVVQILSRSENGPDHSYDMAYIGGTRDLYEGIHTEPLARSEATLSDLLKSFSRFHAQTAQAAASDAVVRDYVTNKAVRNFGIIQDEFADIFEHGRITLNGSSFDTGKLAVFADEGWLLTRLTDRRQASIHGDLTIENVMLDPSGQGWFLIDPNPGNGFESPLIDLAKLMQSLHLGYETVHRDPRSNWSDGVLSVSIHRSAQYEHLLAHLTNSILSAHGEDVLRQVYLHEMINYLRLIPYQIRASRAAGLTFLGCLCILVRDYDSRYPGEF